MNDAHARGSEVNEGPAPGLSLVVPMFNEAEGVERFYQECRAILDTLGRSWEIVCVDDGSRDDTLERLIALHGRDGRVKVVGLARNYGKEAALTAGLNFSRGDLVIPIDADLQDPPELIPQLIEKLEEGYDVVYAVRTRRLGETWLKRTTAHVFYRVIGLLSGNSIPANTGDFRVMRRPVIEALRGFKETHRFMKGLFAWVGFRQTGLEYVRNPRAVGSTKWNYWKLWNFAVEGITSFSFLPLRLSFLLGMCVSAMAVSASAFYVLKKIFYGESVQGFPTLIVSILTLGGIQLIILGVMGEYIGRIYGEVKHRPLYLVSRSAGFREAVEGGGRGKTPPTSESGSGKDGAKVA